MNDTTQEMHQFQYDLIMGKTQEERFGMGLEMIEAGREFMIAGIKLQNPEMTENEILFELLMRQKRYDKSLFWLDYVIADKINASPNPSSGGEKKKQAKE
jgi:hypothetical protein